MPEHNPRATMPKDAKLVAPEDGHEHGYWGQVPDLTPNESYTVAGVTAESEKSDDEKKPAPRPSSRQVANKGADK